MVDPVSLRKPGRAGDTFVIVGAGQAGVQAAGTMRRGGFRGRIVMLGEEPHIPYMRPPLSKKALGGSFVAERILLHPWGYYQGADIELRLATRVQEIDRDSGCVRLSNGQRIPYDRLLLATGSRPRSIDLPGAGLRGVHYLRNLDDATALRTALVPGVRVAVIGGGYIGLEVAATASAAGARVVVYEAADRVMSRVTTEPISEFFGRVHRERGVEIRCGAHVSGLAGDDHVRAVIWDGAPTTQPADLVLIGIGAEPNVDIARDAGLACEDGILVDDRCRTSDPSIFAAGDCTSHPSSMLDRRVRLESVQNAVDQATVAARNMCGEDVPYASVPWFWSHQFDFRLQSAGIAEAFDETEVRGNRDEGAFALLYRRDGETIACDAVNMPGEYMSVRRGLEAKLVEVGADERRASGRQAVG